MRESSFLSEEQLTALEERGDPQTIPHLVTTIRQQQHELESLRLSLDVARRDREELRSALLGAQEHIRHLRQSAAGTADSSAEAAREKG